MQNCENWQKKASKKLPNLTKLRRTLLRGERFPAVFHSLFQNVEPFACAKRQVANEWYSSEFGERLSPTDKDSIPNAKYKLMCNSNELHSQATGGGNRGQKRLTRMDTSMCQNPIAIQGNSSDPWQMRHASSAAGYCWKRVPASTISIRRLCCKTGHKPLPFSIKKEAAHVPSATQ